MEHNAMTPTSGLGSSFHNPPRKWRCSLYASLLMSIPALNQVSLRT